MTAKPKWGFSGSGYVPTFELDSKVRADIAERLGVEPPDEFFRRLEKVISDYRFWKDHADQKPTKKQIASAVNSILATATKLRSELREVDTYSAALIGAIRSNPHWQDGHPIDDCEKPLERLLLALSIAKGKIKAANKEGGRPRSIARKVGLSEDLKAICKDFSINLAPKDFDACLYLVLESAGEKTGMKDDTITKLAQKTRKQKK